MSTIIINGAERDSFGVDLTAKNGNIACLFW